MIFIKIILISICVISFSGVQGKWGGSKSSSSSKSSSTSSKTSHKSPSSSSFGWSSKPSSASHSWNSSPSKAASSYGWNVQGSKLSGNNFRQPSHSTNNKYSSYGYSRNTYGNNYQQPNYGSTFGQHGLPGNSFISNGYFGRPKSAGGSGFLTRALFSGSKRRYRYRSERRGSNNKKWEQSDDEKWRKTTKAPYFANKVPGSNKILPAAAVIGAATAFGLVSLLPLNVVANSPLMYCDQNSSDISQTHISFNGNIYKCINETIFVTNLNCSKMLVNSKNLNESLKPAEINEMKENVKSTFKSDEHNFEIETKEKCNFTENLLFLNGTLISRGDIFCNSTTVMNETIILDETYSNETFFESTIILYCFEGLLPENEVAFIPTQQEFTEAPIKTTTQKSLSLGAEIHLFLLKMIGRGHVVEKSDYTPEQDFYDMHENSWVPEALTIPPEINTEPPPSTTTPKMIWMTKTVQRKEDGTFESVLKTVDDYMQGTLDALYISNPNYSAFDLYVRVPLTTEGSNIETSENPIKSSTTSDLYEEYD